MQTLTKPSQTQEERLQAIERTLRRICAEVDIAINCLQDLLVAQGLRDKARSAGEQLEHIHQEMAEERDTRQPPPEAG